MSGARDESLVLDDLLTATRRLIEIAETAFAVSGVPEQGDGEMLLWNLTVLGEAAKRLPVSVRVEAPEVDWSAMARTRDWVVHHYEGVDWEILRTIVVVDLPVLLPRLVSLRNSRGPFPGESQENP